MELTQQDLEALRKIKSFEDTLDEYNRGIGWTWANVGLYSATIHKLLVKGLVVQKFKSRSSTNYMLTDEGLAALEVGLPVMEAPLAKAPMIDFAQLFSDIVGHDDIKELLTEVLQLEKPIHVLLYGPPSLAKSMFIWDIERVYGELSLPLLGSATSHAGLWDMIAERRPKVILVDELEKMSLTDMAGLLSVMQAGRIIRAKVGRKLDEKFTTWVVGAANTIHRLPAELLSRFNIHQLAEYDAAGFRDVVRSVLVSHEDTDPDTAAEIALRLVGKTHDVRDAVRVARLTKRVGVKRAVELLIR